MQQRPSKKIQMKSLRQHFAAYTLTPAWKITWDWKVLDVINVNACLRVTWERVCPCLSGHIQTQAVPLPSCSFRGSGSDSCPSCLNRAHTVLKKTCSAHCSEVSLHFCLSAGFCQAGQTKDTKKHPTLAARHNEHGNDTHTYTGLKRQTSLSPSKTEDILSFKIKQKIKTKGTEKKHFQQTNLLNIFLLNKEVEIFCSLHSNKESPPKGDSKGKT